MENHFQLTDSDFEQQFANCSLNPTLFNHEAHIRLAWLHLDKYGLNKAMENICTQLKAYVRFLGVEDKYNETLTVAAVKAVYHFKQRSLTTNFIDFILENPRLKYNFKELLSYHYSSDIYNSEKAKKVFLEPELLPFD